MGVLCLPLFLCPLLERQAQKLEREARWLKGKVLGLMGRRKSTQSGSSNSGAASGCMLLFSCSECIMAVVSQLKSHTEEVTITRYCCCIQVQNTLGTISPKTSCWLCYMCLFTYRLHAFQAECIDVCIQLGMHTSLPGEL